MADTGTLVVRVFTSRAEFPVPDASIFVVEQGSQGRDLLAIQTSGRSGTSAPMILASPAPETSQTPNQPTPYASCDIWVERAGYHLLVVCGVQIFPGITSFQNLPLIPQSPADGMTVDSVEITPQNL